MPDFAGSVRSQFPESARKTGLLSRGRNGPALVAKVFSSLVVQRMTNQPPPTRAASFAFASKAAMIASSPLSPCSFTFLSDWSTRL